MTQKNEKSNTKQPINDVAHPDKTPAIATSRPVIVGHAAMIKNDPMVVEDTEEEKSVPTKGVTIEAHTPDKAESEIESTAPAEDDTKDGVVDALLGEIDSKGLEKKQAAEEESRQAEVQKLIESKEFHVPIGQESRRRSMHRVILLLLLLIVLILAGLNFAIDAEAIDIGISALTDIL